MTDDDTGAGRLPGMGQRPVREPRERHLSPRWWVLGGTVLAIGAVVALAIMASTSMALPATTAVLLVAIPVGVGVALRGLALQRRASGARGGSTADSRGGGDTVR